MADSRAQIEPFGLLRSALSADSPLAALLVEPVFRAQAVEVWGGSGSRGAPRMRTGKHGERESSHSMQCHKMSMYLLNKRMQYQSIMLTGANVVIIRVSSSRSRYNVDQNWYSKTLQCALPIT